MVKEKSSTTKAVNSKPILPAAVPGISSISLKNIIISFKHRNYRLWFIGQVVSLFGTWMQTTAQGFFVYELTKSPAYLGYVAFAAGLPSWILMLYGGVIADRFPRRTLLIMTQSSLMVLAFILFGLTAAKLVMPWHIIVLAFLQGVCNAFDAPARQAFVPELVPKNDLTNAIALNSTMFNTATVLGPAFGGVIYALAGPAYCFLINALSFLSVITALLFMKIRIKPREPKKASVFRDILAGLRYSVFHPTIFLLILLVAFVSLFGFSVITLLPAWAVVILKGDATTNGILQSARGIGALMSAVLIASLGRFDFRGKLLALGAVTFPVFLLAFSFASLLPLSVFLLIGVGASIILIYNLANSLIQSLVAEEMRGRVMSLYALTFFGFGPLGGLLLGTLAEFFGEFYTVLGCSVVLLLFSVFLVILNPKLRKL